MSFKVFKRTKTGKRQLQTVYTKSEVDKLVSDLTERIEKLENNTIESGSTDGRTKSK